MYSFSIYPLTKDFKVNHFRNIDEQNLFVKFDTRVVLLCTSIGIKFMKFQHILGFALYTICNAYLYR